MNKIEFNKLIPPNELSNEAYHSLEGISASGLKQAYKDPKLYFHRQDLKRLPSPALEIGKAVHEALLTPKTFDENNYKLTPLNIEKMRIMIHNAKVMFNYILSKTINEHSLIIQDEGFIRRIRIDAYEPKRGVIFDVKTTRYPNKTAFIKDAYDLGYHLQQAFYIDTMKMAGFKVNAFAFLVIPSDSPCEPFAVQFDEQFTEDGRAIYGDVIKNILDYEASNDSILFHQATLPKWRLDQLGA